MSSKSQLGYIMDLLEISGTDLAKITSLDRTLISKWKNNSRQLKEESPHFLLIITELIHYNKNRNDNTLERFFREIYPTIDRNEPDYLNQCLSKWLVGDDLGTFHSVNDWKRSESSLYTTKIEIFKGDEGKRHALIEFFEYALELPDVHEIFISDTENSQWLDNDADFYGIYHEYIDQLAHRGHHINIIYSTESNSEEMFKIDYNRLNKYFTGNVTAYKLPENVQGPSLYIIHNHMLLLSSNFSNRTSNRYIAIYRDLFSIQQYVSMFASRLNNAEKLLSSYNSIGSNFRGFSENLMSSVKLNSSYYYVTSMPPFSMFSESRIKRILQNNNLTIEQKDQILLMYEVNNMFFNNGCEMGYIKTIISYQHVIEALSHDTIKLNDMSSVINQDVYISKEELLQQLNELNELMKSSSRFDIHLVNFDQTPSLKQSILWVIEDTLLYSYAFNKSKYFVLSNSSAITREAIQFITQFLLPTEYKYTLNDILNRIT